MLTMMVIYSHKQDFIDYVCFVEILLYMYVIAFPTQVYMERYCFIKFCIAPIGVSDGDGLVVMMMMMMMN